MSHLKVTRSDQYGVEISKTAPRGTRLISLTWMVPAIKSYRSCALPHGSLVRLQYFLKSNICNVCSNLLIRLFGNNTCFVYLFFRMTTYATVSDLRVTILVRFAFIAHWCHIHHQPPKQARNQLGTSGGRVFWEGPKFFKLCPVVLNYVQHILPGEGKIFSNPPATADYGPALNLMSHDY